MTLTPEQEKERQYFISELNRTRPLHAGQIPIAAALFRDGKKKIFGQCGRKFGKSFFARYCAYRMAGSIPKLPVYVILPVLKQAKEIYWIPRLMQDFVHPRFIKKLDNQDYRVTLWNDSFIKLDGSDNPEMHRGPEVGFLINDEVKDEDPYYWPAMRPNLVRQRAPFLCLGTPPENEVTPKEKAFHAMVAECRGSPDGFFAQLPCTLNPELPPEELENIRIGLINTGQEDVWEREYLGIYKRGGAKWVFPHFSDEKHVKGHDDLIAYLTWKVGLNELDFFCVADPGTAKIFGMLFIAYHRPTRRIYVLDELYVSDQTKNSVRAMYDEEERIIREIFPYPEDWRYVYDEAALWFWNERATNAYPRRGWTPTCKAQQRKQFQETKPGTSLLKTLFAYDYITISSRCTNLVEEIKSYSIDANGNLSSGSDHLLDCTRYFLFSCGYQMPTIVAPELPLDGAPPSPRRAERREENVDFDTGASYEGMIDTTFFEEDF